MKLAARLWIFGAALPALCMALAFFIAGAILERSLDTALDEALLAQATVEVVSLFDGPDGPHLHMEDSPLLEQVRPFAPVASVYGPDGRRLLVFPRGADAPATLAHRDPDEPPLLHEEGKQRVLEVTIRSPNDGGLLTLRLAGDLGAIEATLIRYRAWTGMLTLLLAVVLSLVQARQARSLGTRVGSLVRSLRRIGAGDFEAPPPDGAGDEISHLRDGIARAALDLREARDARERFLADAAHELRTPLASMRTALDLALRRQRSPDELRAALEETREEVDRLARLASRLLDRAAIRSAKRSEPVDLRALAEEAVAAVGAAASERGLEVRIEGAAPPIRGDAAALRQALDNALDNAIKFSPEGGTIRLSLETRGDRLRLSIRDEGPGIPAAEREAVFEPFYRAVRSVPGTGLGLTLVREILEAHGGTARFEGDGPGALLVLEWPLEGRAGAADRPAA